MNIVIKNLRNEKPVESWQVRVDRASPLGNPFFMKNEEQRDLVCDKYVEWFADVVDNIEADYPLQRREIGRLLSIYKQYGKLELFCWCVPRRCHAETIKDYLTYKYKGTSCITNTAIN